MTPCGRVRWYKYLHSVVFYIIVVRSHEYHVDNNTESDEQLCERVKHNDGQNLRRWMVKLLLLWLAVLSYLCSSYPEPAAVPDTHHVRSSLDTVKHDVLHLGSLVVIILNRECSRPQLRGQYSNPHLIGTTEMCCFTLRPLRHLVDDIVQYHHVLANRDTHQTQCKQLDALYLLYYPNT